MDSKKRILYVEDDEVLGFVTKDNLELSGYAITHCSDGMTALGIFKNGEFELCILDVMLPEMDGFQLAREIRQINSAVPIIFLTAKSMKEDKLFGLRLGADDYITKPFSIEELILKIEVFLKRKHINEEPKIQQFNIGIFHLDYRNLKLLNGEVIENLTQKEGDLLKLLIQNKNNIIKRNEILKKLWGQDDYFMGRSMDVFISRLRKYLRDDKNLKIENVHGVGFRLIEKETNN
jgi:DNA-binding response OmpR family regulator